MRQPELAGNMIWQVYGDFSAKKTKSVVFPALTSHYVGLEIQLIWSFGREPFCNATAVGSQQVTGWFQAAPILTDHTIY